jgi:cation-transporting ATPase 13A3/4/5
VIACATRYERKLSWMKVQKLTRTEAESNLEFAGFIIFENKLKSTTTDVITELNQAGIRNAMCTGDNILTAISVARECKMVGPNEQCFIPHFIEGNFNHSLIINRWCANNLLKNPVLLPRLLLSGKVWMIRISDWIRERFWYGNIYSIMITRN